MRRIEVLGTDLDGCLSDHDWYFCQYAKKLLNLDYTPEGLPQPSKKTQQQFNPIFCDPDYWREMPAWKDAAYITAMLDGTLDIGLHVFTLRPNYGGLDLTGLTREWLRKRHIVYDVLSVETGAASAVRFDYATAYGVFVEDNLKNALRMAGGCERVFLMDHPYNRAGDLPANIQRVRGWREIYDWLRKRNADAG